MKVVKTVLLVAVIGISKRPYLEAMERDDTQSIKLPQKAHKKPIKSRKEKK